MKTKIALAIAGFGLLGYGLYRYFTAQARMLLDFTYSYSGFKIKKISLNELNFDLIIRFQSKADLEAKIQKMYFDIYIQDVNVGYLIEEKPFIIPAHGSSDIPLTFSVNPQSVFKDIVGIGIGIAQMKDVKIKLDGYAKIKTGILTLTLPVKYETTIKEYLGIK
jgi:LEA14-like dessication related protein